VTATDGLGAQASGSFTLTVDNVNDAPTLDAPITNQTATEDSPFTFVVPANTFSDVDVGDTLTYTATRTDGTALPSWLRFDAAALGFSGTPQRMDAGTLDIRVTATDLAGVSASGDFRVVVVPLPFVPTAPAAPPVPTTVFAPPAPAPALAPLPPAVAAAVPLPPAAPMPAPAADSTSASLTSGGNTGNLSPTSPAPSAAPAPAPSNAPTSAASRDSAAGPAAADSQKVQQSAQGATPTPAATGQGEAVTAAPADASNAAGNSAPAAGGTEPSAQSPARAETSSGTPVAATVAELGRWVAGSGLGGSLMAPAPVQPSLSWAPIGQLDLASGAFDSALGLGSSSASDGTASQRVDNSFRQLREDAQEEAFVEQGVVASSVVVSTGFSVGYVLWLARGGALLASLASAIPAWAMVDPLPVLSKLRPGGSRDPDAQDPDPGADNHGMPGPTDDQVEDMFGTDGRAAAAPRTQPPLPTPPMPTPPLPTAAPHPGAEAQP
jgi:hypothetical protein